MKPCKYDAYEAVPKGRIKLDLDEAEKTLSRNGYEVLSNPKVMLVVRKGVEVTIYPGGRLLMNPIASREQAETVAKELYKALGR